MHNPAAPLVLTLALAACAPQPPAWSAIPVCPEALEGELPEFPGECDGAMVPSANERAPDVTNRVAAALSLERHYPPAMKTAGEGGTVVTWVLLDHEGVVRDASVARSSGRVELDRAAMIAIRDFRFSPALLDGCRTATWIEMPLTFSVGRAR